MFIRRFVCYLKEAIESLPGNDVLDIDEHRKLHLLNGGTKVVNHTPPPKTSAGLKCKINTFCIFQLFHRITLFSVFLSDISYINKHFSEL